MVGKSLVNVVGVLDVASCKINAVFYTTSIGLIIPNRLIGVTMALF